MDRRQFLRRAALVASGAIAADQFELLDRLGWVRRFFAGFGPGIATRPPVVVTSAEWDALLRECYVSESIADVYGLSVTPFLTKRGMGRKPKSLLHPREFEWNLATQTLEEANNPPIQLVTEKRYRVHRAPQVIEL